MNGKVIKDGKNWCELRSGHLSPLVAVKLWEVKIQWKLIATLVIRLPLDILDTIIMLNWIDDCKGRQTALILIC